MMVKGISMPTTKQQSFLQELLDGTVPTLERIQRLLHERVDEDLHLDDKAGRWVEMLPRPKKGERLSAEVRRYIAGFANAEGGVIAIGVSGHRDSDGARMPEPVTRWKSSIRPVSGTQSDVVPYGDGNSAAWFRMDPGRDGIHQRRTKLHLGSRGPH